jgi:hypothetical protein
VPGNVPIPTFTDDRGALSVLDGELPFPVRRVYWLHSASPEAGRAGHRHRRNRQLLVCVSGRCDVFVDDGNGGRNFPLASPSEGLLLEPADWHRVSGFSPGAVLMVLASEPYDPGDYVDEPYA